MGRKPTTIQRYCLTDTLLNIFPIQHLKTVSKECIDIYYRIQLMGLKKYVGFGLQGSKGNFNIFFKKVLQFLKFPKVSEATEFFYYHYNPEI